jgi:hypothetical protein
MATVAHDRAMAVERNAKSDLARFVVPLREEQPLQAKLANAKRRLTVHGLAYSRLLGYRA